MPVFQKGRIVELVNIFGSFWPIFSIFFLILASIFNKSIHKGIFYLFGLVLIIGIWTLVLWGIDKYKYDDTLDTSETGSFICKLSTLNIFNFYESQDLTINIRPISFIYPLSTPVLWYTNWYLFLTLFHGKSRAAPNGIIITIFLLGTIFNLFSNIFFNKCGRDTYSNDTLISPIPSWHIGLGYLFGFLVGSLGVIWYFAIMAADSNLLFSDILYQNDDLCKLNKDRNFKCDLYRDGVHLNRGNYVKP